MDEVEIGKKKRQILKEFIQLYESFPCLWHIKSKEYHDRELRTKAYNVLVRKLQQLQKGADRSAVVKKINCLRSNLRKEKRKALEYLKNGRVYRTKLWYYHLFHFLNDIHRQPQAELRRSEGSIDLKYEDDRATDDPLQWASEVDEEPMIEVTQNDVSLEDESCEHTTYEIETLHLASPSNNENTENILNYQTVEGKLKPSNQGDEIRESFKRGYQEDRHDVFGKNVAMKLRHISPINDTQRLMAEKVINDALYMAEMGLLTMEHCALIK